MQQPFTEAQLRAIIRKDGVEAAYAAVWRRHRAIESGKVPKASPVKKPEPKTRLTAQRIELLRRAAQPGGVMRTAANAKAIGYNPRNFNCSTSCMVTAGILKATGGKPKTLHITDRGRQMLLDAGIKI